MKKPHYIYLHPLFYVYFLCSIVTYETLGQGLEIEGQVRIEHYNKDLIGIDAQFWDMAEDSLGVLYFGNNKGISIYDGNEWSLLSLPNNSAVKSIGKTSDGTILAGGSNEFGSIDKDEFGNYYYRSYIDLLEKGEQQIDEIWQIISFDQTVAIRTFTTILILEKNKLRVLPTENTFRHIKYIDGYLYVVDDQGVSRLDPKSLESQLLFPSSAYENQELISLHSSAINYELLGFTKEGNAYVFNLKNLTSNRDYTIIKHDDPDQIFTVTAFDNNQFLIGSINSQILVYDHNNKSVSPLREDLQNQTVLKIRKSSDENFWIMLNRGIDFLEYSYPGSTLFDKASVYDVAIGKEFIYAATNQGVYAARVDENKKITPDKFKLIESLSAQAWNLNTIDDRVFVGHDKGAFIIDGITAVKIDGISGIWKVIPIAGKDELLLACAYSGIYVLAKSGDSYAVRNKIENFDTSSRDIFQINEQGSFWICHGYEGVYKIKIDDHYEKVVAIEHFTENDGLPSRYNINVSSYQDQVVFLSKYGFYQFLEDSNRFSSLDKLNSIFHPQLDVSKIASYQNRTWFIQNEELGYFDHGIDSLTKDLFNSLKGTFITSMEYLHPIDDNRVLVATNEGIHYFDLSKKTDANPKQTLFSSIDYQPLKDSTLRVNLRLDSKKNVFSHDATSFRFSFGAPALNPKKNVKYSFKLEGFDSNWSDWSTSREQTFSYLPEGTYVFKVKGQSITGELSEETSYTFTILPIWYRTKYALIGFTTILIVVFYLGYKITLSYISALRKEDLKLRHALEAEIETVKIQKEKEIIEQNNFQLKEDIVNKSKEIANYTILLVKKHDLLEEIGSELNEIKKSAKLEKTRTSLRVIAQKIRRNLQDEEHLQIFDTNFEKVHQSFFSILREKYPDIQQKELRLCGFIKMNMSNKEIASILHISTRGVESARYRLRKRLDLDNEVTLVEYLQGL